MKASLDAEEFNVLVMGNNPTELGHVFESLDRIQDKKITTVIAFDVKTLFERLANFRPSFILIDDNIGKSELKSAVKALLNSRKTKGVPITVLKNSNYQEAINSGVMNYVLKKGLTGEALYRAFKGSLRSITTQKYLFDAYKKRSGQMLRLLK